MLNLPTYIVITPAKNESDYIELTIQSVISQTIKPIRWIIVSDGSTDGTDEIVQRYIEEYPWIELVQIPQGQPRDFAGKVYAFNAGYAQVKNMDYDVIVSLDADISFDPDYFAYLLSKLASDTQLGLVGTPFLEGSKQLYDYRYTSIEHVSGACQVFRRQCFEDIGGYVPVKGGLIDRIAVITARMKGWKTRTFVDKACQHHRIMGTAQGGEIRAKFKSGEKDYAIGNNAAWEAFRVLYQIRKKPFIIGGLALAAGYVFSFVRRRDRAVSQELMRFHRREQMQRLAKAFSRATIPLTNIMCPRQQSVNREQL